MSRSSLQSHQPVRTAIVLLAVALLMLGCSRGSAPDTGQNAELDQKISSLKTDVDIGHFDSLLGKPAMKNDKVVKIASYTLKRHGRPKQVIEEIKYLEHFYVHQHFVVQAITDEAGKVGLYSVMARSADYLPNINTELGEPVRLGKSVYADLQKKPVKIVGRLGTNFRDASYYEIFLVEGQKNKLAVFSSNPNGYLKNIGRLDDRDSGMLISRFSAAAENFPLTATHDVFRKSSTINTYSVVAPWLRGIDMTTEGANYGEALINFGPRADQMAAWQ